jgi:hypothetical protein
MGEVNMFCPKCGADAQNAESYCTRCGEWLPDLKSLTRPGLFRKRTREEKIRKIRVLEAISAGLALTAAAMIFAVLRGSADTQLLFLSLLCCLIVAVYQIVNFYLGSTLQKKIEQSRLNVETHKTVEQLGSRESTTFVNPHSVVEKTTKHLDAVPRNVKR